LVLIFFENVYFSGLSSLQAGRLNKVGLLPYLGSYMSVKFSCYIIGGDSIALECATMLHTNGHNIQGIITTYIPLQTWATANNIPNYQNVANSDILSPNISFDYIISIVNT